MEVALALLADAANVSSDGKLNILGIFNEIRASTFPATHPVMRLVLQFESSAAEAGREKEVEILLLDEDGGELARAGVRVPLGRNPSGDAFTTNTIVELRGISFPRAGRYAIHVLIGGDERRRVPLRVSAVEQLQEG